MTMTMTIDTRDSSLTYSISPQERAERFLILGSEGGTFYVGERELTLENAKNLREFARSNGPELVDMIIDVSVKGRAAKVTPTLFALAVAQHFGSIETRKLVYQAIEKVVRNGSHLLEFVSFTRMLGDKNSHSWSRGLRKALAYWYDSRTLDDVSYQVTKYPNRYGVTHKDVLTLVSGSRIGRLRNVFNEDGTPKLDDQGRQVRQDIRDLEPERGRLYRYITGKSQQTAAGLIPPTPTGRFVIAKVRAFNEMEGTPFSVKARFIRESHLTHEMIPTDWKRDAEVWQALLEDMPIGAMVRNLGNMGKVGLLSEKSNALHKVLTDLTNQDRLRKGRIHPIDILKAYMVYKLGHGIKGDGKWDVEPKLVTGLNEAFYGTFGNVKAMGTRILVGIDVSGSMAGGVVCGVPGLVPRMAAAAMASIHIRTEKDPLFYGFSDEFIQLDFKKDDTIEDIIRKSSDMSFNYTDCSLPIHWARKNNVGIDTFIVYTDNETNAGQRPADALRSYREKTGIPAKMIVVGMTANDVSIIDPNDPGSLGVAGFDTAVPNVMSDFASKPLVFGAGLI